jgi:FlaA1/EpsC-like NDP-sugar epimerase
MKRLKIHRNFSVVITADIVLIAMSYILAYVVRFDARIYDPYFSLMKHTIIPLVIIKLAIFYLFDLYRGMWRFTSLIDISKIVGAVITSSATILSLLLMFNRFKDFSRSVFIIDAAFTFILVAGIRVIIRVGYAKYQVHINPFNKRKLKNKAKKLVVIGAGYAGQMVAREVLSNPNTFRFITGFLDDDKNKIGRQIHGIKVLGRIFDLNNIVEQTPVDEILIAIPSAPGKKIREIVELCKSTNIPFKTLPGMGEIIDGNVSIKKTRDISYKDLLRRPSIRLHNDKIAESLHNKCVLITGAGGSIGSELCRQICRFNPALLVLFDASEANLYSIQMELKHYIRHIKYRAVLGHVQDRNLVDRVFNHYRPSVIFHAAAYKHVPIIERNPWEAVFSNILGTSIIVKAAIDHKVDRFVLVSTDKAVRPTNVMGASKRVSEMIIHAKAGADTKFMAVRFGNVIGSSGSVIPLFRQQIERGGPVTVTHPEITRYFMTIEEAAQLILQAFTMGQGGETFILEMGTPVKIVDMAKDLIRLYGKEHDIDINFIGLRPGEKLYEELITEGEGIVKTGHEKILVIKNGTQSSNDDCRDNCMPASSYLDQRLEELVGFAHEHNAIKIKCKLRDIVPEYTMSDDECVI